MGSCFIFALRWALPQVVATRRGRLVTAALAAVVVVGGALVVTSVEVVGPWDRLAYTLPSASHDSVRAFVVEAWDRNGYGGTATRIIADFPFVGVGVGAFHAVGPDVCLLSSATVISNRDPVALVRSCVRSGAGAVWGCTWVLALVLVGGLSYVSWTELRVPFRARQADWDYSYGFYASELDQTGDEFRWAAGRAVAAMPVDDDVIELSAWTHHPDVGEDPVELKVWLDGELVLDDLRENGDPITRTVPRPRDQDRVVIETWVNRTWSPNDYGENDTRAIGPGIRWRFFEQ